MIFFKEITTLQKTGETSEKICTALVYSSDDMDLGKGHGELLELRLLKKSARHDFIIARQRSNNNIISSQRSNSTL